MFIAGFFLTCGHSFVFMAYRMAPARVVAPFNYSFMIWAGLSGLLVFSQVPNALGDRRHAAHHGGGPCRRHARRPHPAGPGCGRGQGLRWPKPVLIVLHSEMSTPGRIGHMLVEKGYALDIRRPCLGDDAARTRWSTMQALRSSAAR